MIHSVGVLVYDGVDLLQLAAPYAVFAAMPSHFELNTVGRTKEIISCSGGLQILPDHIYPDAQIYDVIVIPGGPGSEEAAKNLRLVNWITRAARLAKIVAAVGQGNLLAGHAGLLHGHPIPLVEGIAEAFPNAVATDDEGPVGGGKYLGIATARRGRELALTVLSRLVGKEAAEQIDASISF